MADLTDVWIVTRERGKFSAWEMEILDDWFADEASAQAAADEHAAASLVAEAETEWANCNSPPRKGEWTPPEKPADAVAWMRAQPYPPREWNYEVRRLTAGDARALGVAS